MAFPFGPTSLKELRYLLEDNFEIKFRLTEDACHSDDGHKRQLLAVAPSGQFVEWPLGEDAPVTALSYIARRLKIDYSDLLNAMGEAGEKYRDYPEHDQR